jgi:hypothetical protein
VRLGNYQSKPCKWRARRCVGRVPLVYRLRPPSPYSYRARTRVAHTRPGPPFPGSTFFTEMDGSSSAEEKISAALNRELEVVEKESMRSMQRQAFLCSAKCCEDQQCSQEILQKCLHSCMRPMMEAEQKLKAEVEQFQGRLTRCAQQCEDECRDMLPPSASQQNMDRVQKHAERCLMKCADDNISRIPQLIDRFRHSLGSSNSSSKRW